MVDLNRVNKEYELNEHMVNRADVQRSQVKRKKSERAHSKQDDINSLDVEIPNNLKRKAEGGSKTHFKS